MGDTVVIFGAGCAGLSTAHYLVQRGYKVTVIEKLPIPGGMARSQRVDKNIPSEYSWRAWGPFYSNTYDVMNDIPFKGSTVLKEGFSGKRLRPQLIADNMNNGTRTTLLDKIKIGWLFLDGWCSSEKRNTKVHANTYSRTTLKKYLTPIGANTINSIDGPFTGSDYGYITDHHLYSFYKKTFFAQCSFKYQNGKLTKGTSRYNNSKKWITLQGPTNEYFFDPWVEYLTTLGVEFRFNTALSKINYSSKIQSMTLDDNTQIVADNYVLPINPFILRDILDKTPQLKDEQLHKIKLITQQDEHRQISFRLAFKEKIHFKNPNDFIVLTDSEYCITFYSCDNLWDKDVDLGYDVQSLWSGTATVDSCKGKLYNLPMKEVTYEQFVQEIKYQIYKSKNLDNLIKFNNNGRSLSSFEILIIEVYPEWNFPSSISLDKIISGNQPKWVNTIKTRSIQPTTKTSIPGLYLAGAHCKTSADLWCMEGAIESGRSVADDISQQKTTIKYIEPAIFKPFKAVDSVLYDFGLPGVITCLWILIIIVLIVLFIYTYSLFVLLTLIIMTIMTILLNT